MLDELPFLAVVFRQGSHGSIFDVPVQPTQIIEVGSALCLAGLLAWMWHRARRFDGQVFAAMLLGYGCVRWITEGFRGDVVRGVAHELGGWSLSTGRISSLVIGFAAVLLIAVRYRSGVAPEPVSPPEHIDEPVVLDASGLDD